tara:strand:+ start:26675 stop:27145 length:471 start_codon:yes stop_codon:yes gene_type:complete
MFYKLCVLLGNYLPPKLNMLFYKLGGVKLGIKNCWIGNKCYLDTQFPDLIEIKKNVCISANVFLIAHFDPTMANKKHLIKKYKKKIIINEGVFIGPNSMIMPGVTLGKNVFVKAGTVISKSIPDNLVVEGNPHKILFKMDEKHSNLINSINKNNLF